MKKIRVRTAPSPTGIPHIGNTRTALFNFLFAKKNKGEFILRIDDTDQKRIIPEALVAIDEIFEWLGISFDQKFTQSERLDEYKKHAIQLVDKGLAYEKEGAIWFDPPGDGEISWRDMVGDKTISFKGADIEDFVILKSDGFPTYHLASVIDDNFMEITHVIRGDEWISSTPKHLLLIEAFSWNPPIFAHLPVILGSDKTKLSKRHGAKSVLDYKNKGYLPEAVISYMALLGWNPGGEKEIFDVGEIEERFDFKDVNTGSPIFDNKKLEWMNGEWIRKIDASDLKSRINKLKIKELQCIDDKLINKIVLIAQTRMKTLNDFSELAIPFLQKTVIELDDEEKEARSELKDRLQNLDNWDKDKIIGILKKILEDKNVKFPYLYKIIIGKDRGLPLAEVFEALGKNKTFELLQ